LVRFLRTRRAGAQNAQPCMRLSNVRVRNSTHRRRVGRAASSPIASHHRTYDHIRCAGDTGLGSACSGGRTSAGRCHPITQTPFHPRCSRPGLDCSWNSHSTACPGRHACLRKFLATWPLTDAGPSQSSTRARTIFGHAVGIRTFFDSGCSRHRCLATAEEQTQLVISFNTLITWRRVPLTRTFIFARAIEDPKNRVQGQLPAKTSRSRLGAAAP